MANDDKIIRLRPHHLLCTQGYSGKGYDENFVLNMTLITDRMRTDPDLKVQIVFSTDDICRFCPRKRGEGICPECASVLYRYEKCQHVFKDGRCIKCLWDGSRSDYIKSMME